MTGFFHDICIQPTTAKMHKIFIAKMSYCACRVLSHATTRNNCYFNFILNKTRSGRELFDRPSDINMWVEHICQTTSWFPWQILKYTTFPFFQQSTENAVREMASPQLLKQTLAFTDGAHKCIDGSISLLTKLCYHRLTVSDRLGDLGALQLLF